MGPFLRSTRHGLFAASPLALVLFAMPVSAAWSPTGETVPVADCPHSSLAIAACDDGSRGLFTFWSPLSNPMTVFGQRRLADGSVAPGWLAAGNTLGQLPQWGTSLLAVPARDGGAWLITRSLFLAAINQQVHVWRVSASGTLAAGWPDAGIALGDDTSPKDAMLADDGTGGVLVGWVECLRLEVRGFSPALYTLNAVRLVRLDGSGAPAPGWSLAGNTVFMPDTSGPLAIRRVPTTMVADGSGGAWICHADSTDGLLDSRLFRMTPAGALAPGFSTDGVLVGTPGDVQSIRAIAEDGAGGVFTLGSAADLSTRLARFQPSGQPAPGWSASGLAVLPGVEGLRDFSTLTSDGSGGVVVSSAFDDATTSHTSCRLQRFDSGGAIAAGWPVDGVAIDADLGPFRGTFTGLHPDGAGGAYFVGRKQVGDPASQRGALLVTRVAADGTFPVGWSARPVVVDTVDDQGLSTATPDRRGALFVVHARTPNTCPVLANRFGPDGSSTAGVDDPPAPVRAALRTYPNPMGPTGSLRLSIPYATWVTVDVLDSAGRRVRTLGHVQVGPADRRFDWDGRDQQGRPVAPGVYLFRVRGPGLDHSERIVRLL